MGTGTFYPEKKTKFFSGLKIPVPRVPPITTAVSSGFTLFANVCPNLPDVRIYPTSPLWFRQNMIKYYRLMRGLGPDVVPVVGPTGV